MEACNFKIIEVDRWVVCDLNNKWVTLAQSW